MKKLLLIILVIITSLSVKAQTAGITGKVTDSTGSKGLDKATVKLVEKDSPSDTLRTSTNAKGEFSFAKVPTSAYSIVVSYTGYKPMIKEFFKPSAGVSNIDLGELVLVNSYLDLKEIVIEAPAVTMKEDTVEYRAGAFQTKPNATTEELLKKLPGVQVDREGNVTAQGKQVTRVKVNGKDFFTGDPKTATKEIPADMIDKVQVIDDYGDQSTVSGIRDGEPEKVINLQLKKDKNKGVFGRAQAGYGTNDRYTGALTVNRFNNSKQLSIVANSNNVNTSTFQQDGNSGGGNTGGGGGGRGGMGISFGGGGGGGGNSGANQNGITKLNSIGLNYRNDFGKRNSFYGSYTYSHRNTAIEQYSAQQTNGTKSDRSSILQNAQRNSLNKSGTHRAFANLELWIDSFNYIKFSPNFTFSDGNNSSFNDFDIFRDSLSNMIQTGINRNSSLSDRPNFRSNLLYNHRFKKRGRNFSFNSDINFSSNESDQFTNNHSIYYISGSPKDSVFNQNILQDNRNKSINLRITYTEPIAADRFLDLNYNYNKNFGTNDRQNYVQLPANGDYRLIDSLSNAYENNFDYNRIGASIRTVKKKYNYSIGVIFQPVLMKGYDINKDSAYTPIKNFNWFPVARFTYNFTRTKSLNFNYNGSARQPNFEQLQPVPDYSDPQNPTVGNALLKPSTSHNFNTNFNNFNFSSGRIFLVNVGFNFVNDQIVNNTIRFRDANGKLTGVQLTRPENVDGYYNANLFTTYSRPFKNRKYVISANSMLNYNNNVSLIDSERTIGKNWLYSQGANFEFNLPWLELVTGGRYNLNYADFTQAEGSKTTQSTWTLSSDARFDFGAGFIFRWDFDYTINQGLAQGVQKNIALLNASLEKEVFKKKNGVFRLAGFDIFNQNTNVNRSINSNFITDTRTNRLTQYFMLSFTYRLNKFTGTQPQQNNNFRRMGGGERTIIND